MGRPRHEQGLAAATIILLVLVIMVAIIAGRGASRKEPELGQQSGTDARLRRVADALVEYAALHQRLPCPAAGNLPDGTEQATALPACDSPAGVVPWATLGLRRDDALDGWGRKISYRVDSANRLTQAGGISMTDCNSHPSATSPVDANGRCPATHFTGPAAFLAGKGLSIQTDAATTAGFAFVLISHGGTGAGAFGAEGGARVPLPAAGALEYRNTQAGTTFDSRARSAPGVAPTDAAYFDDAVLALSIADVANAARLSARDWGDVTSALLAASTLASQTFTRADIAAGPGAIADFNTGQNTLNFGALTARAVGAGAVNVSSGIGTSGQGIGAIGALSNLGTAAPLDSAAGEGLDFRFATNTGRYLGISLVDFGDRGGLLGIERVRFRFLQGGTPVASIDKPACRAGDVRANFLLDPGAPFDEVVVTPITTTTGSNSTLLVGGLRSCTALLGANSCTAAGAIPADDCP